MSQHAPRVTGEELIAALLRGAFVRLRQEGSHVRLLGPQGQLVTVKRTNRNLKLKTLASALRQAGWTYDELRRNL